MSSDWPFTTVGDVATIVTKGTTPTTLGFNYQEDGIRFVKVESIAEDGSFIRDKLAYISADADAALARSRLRPDDVLFTIAGTIGRVALLPSWLIPANTNQAVAIIRPDTNKILPRFLKYAVANEAFVRHASTRIVQGVQANFSLGELKAGRIRLPAMAEQVAVCEVLGALDDRIDNLRDTNATLEAITQALFKSWFVDFDPVHAKAEGREPEGMDAATADLFPSEFEESELGPIPKGWHAGTLDDVSHLNVMSWSSRRHPDAVIYVDLSGVHENRIGSVNELPFSEAPSRARRSLRDGDTIVGTVRPGNRAFAYIHRPTVNLTGSTGFAVLSPKDEASAPFVYLAATRDDSIERLTNLADGGAYPAVRPDVVSATPAVISPASIITKFSRITAPMLHKISESRNAEAALAEIRDTLLPRLISGKLRLSEGM